MNVAETGRAILSELTEALPGEEENFEKLAAALDSAPQIFVTAAGRSLLMVKAFAMRLMHLGYPVHVTGDVTTPALRKGDLLLAASGSGETAGILRTVIKAKDLGAVTALITANPGSSIAREAELVIGLPAQKSSQPGASLFEQELLITLDAFIAELMRTKELPPETVYSRHANLE